MIQEANISGDKMESTEINSGNRVKVGLVQINNSFSGAEYFPYSVGLLQAYVQKYAKCPERFDFLLPVYTRLPVELAVEQLLDADIVGFSTYVWNIRLSLEIARQLKERKPEVLIVFGGPQVPDRAEDFIKKYPFIDLACHGEAERVFLNLLEAYPSTSWAESDLDSVSFLDVDG